jgi:hypothetical protein
MKHREAQAEGLRGSRKARRSDGPCLVTHGERLVPHGLAARPRLGAQGEMVAYALPSGRLEDPFVDERSCRACLHRAL